MVPGAKTLWRTAQRRNRFRAWGCGNRSSRPALLSGRRRRLCMGWGPPGGRVRQHLLLDWEHWAARAEHSGHAAELWCEWHSWSSRETCHSVPSQGTQEAPPAPLGYDLLRSGAPNQELCVLKAPASRGLNALPYSLLPAWWERVPDTNGGADTPRFIFW